MTRILILGASGQVGQQILQQALAEPSIKQICAPSRKPLKQSAKHLLNPLVDFANLPASAPWWQSDIVLCALGTTMKLAGSRPAFYQVDHDYVVLAARLAYAAGARCFVLNSSLGAKLDASFYLQVKAETERDVELIGYPSLIIARPSLLIAENRPEHRFGESLGVALASIFRPLIPKRYRPISCEKVARAMLQTGLQQAQGKQMLESEQLAKFS